MKNNRHFRTRLGTTLGHCRLILETETEPGTKSCVHYLCPQVADQQKNIYIIKYMITTCNKFSWGK